MTDPAISNTGSVQPDSKKVDDEVASAQPVVPYAKARRYLGLLIALGFMTVMFWQVERYPRGASNFMARTTLTSIIASTDRGVFAREMRVYEARCSYAQKTADDAVGPQTRASAARHARSECDPEPMLHWTVDTLVRLGRLEPKFFDLSQEYRALKTSAQDQQGLTFRQAPQMTDEMREIAGQLLKPLIVEALAAEKWVARMILVTHALVLLVGVWGVVYRQALGSIAIAPLGWIFGFGRSSVQVAKEIHKKI